MLSMPMPLLTFRLHNRSIDSMTLATCACCVKHEKAQQRPRQTYMSSEESLVWPMASACSLPSAKIPCTAHEWREHVQWTKEQCRRWRRKRRGDGGWVSNHNSLSRDLVHLAAGGREAGAHDVGSRHHELDRSSVHLHLGKDVGIWRSRASDLKLGQKWQKRQRRDGTFVQKTKGGIVGAISDVEEEHGLIHHHKVDVALAARLEPFGSLRGSSTCT
jgi:hypothetical protein